MDPIIQIEQLGKRYVIQHATRAPYQTLREVIASWPRRLLSREADTKEEFWALRDLTFDVQLGDRLGIIGRNGAGKSTLLKVLSRITAPTTGRVTMMGRVASLLEVGTGFHPELSGRDNIFLNGAVLGMSRAEVRRRFDEIVDFSGVEKFLDTPVKRYSSGMYVRLAFAVAAHLESEILIIDEVLSVGDLEFQKKCLGKMDDVAKSEGRTLLFVSHNMGAIQQLCSSAVVLAGGQVAFHGAADDAIRTYVDSQVSGDTALTRDRSNLGARNQFVTAFTTNLEDHRAGQFAYDEGIRLHFEVAVPEWTDGLTVSVCPCDTHRRRVFTIEVPLKERYEGRPLLRFAVSLPGGFLAAGEYTWTLYIHEPLVRLYELLENTCDFTVLETGSVYAKYEGYDYGCVYPPAYSVQLLGSSSLVAEVEPSR